MLNRRQFTVGLATLPALAGPAFAQDFAADLQASLEQDGFRIESVGRTLLGRVRILAQNASGEREIILNPRTGEILRDLWITRGKTPSTEPQQGGNGVDQGGGEDHDDEGEKDGGNSGHGGGGNGGKGGSSGEGGDD